MLRTAIIGVGWAGARHAEAIRELEAHSSGRDDIPPDRKIAVECLVDNDPDFLASKASELSVPKTYTNHRDALADPKVDAVSICAPHALHCPIAVDAAQAGKHILVEKPMALTVAEATRMMQEADKNGVKLYVAENVCYSPQSETLRAIVQSGRHIGELTAASVVNGFRAPDYGYPDRRAWLSTPQEGGTGSWMLHGIHRVAQLRFVLGEVAKVYLCEHKASSFSRTDLEATMSGLFTLTSGQHLSIVQTCETRLYGNLGGYIMHGDQGSIRASEIGYEIYDEENDGTFVPYADEDLSSYAREYQAFADYVAGTATGPTTAASERRSLAVVEAGYASVHNGQSIDLKEYFGEL